MYLHVVEQQTPFEETARAIDAAHKAGKFKRFGLSNYRPDEVEAFLQIAKDNNLVPVTVYQGHYNAIARLPEDTLIPTLRKHNIAFYAYSPGASGMFTGKVNHESTKKEKGRFGPHKIGEMYRGYYHKDEIFESAQKVHDLATKYGISGHAVALRWLLHHSALDGQKGDAMIIGAHGIAQLEENLGICKRGPLPADIVELIEHIWPTIKPVAPVAYIPYNRRNL